MKTAFSTLCILALFTSCKKDNQYVHQDPTTIALTTEVVSYTPSGTGSHYWDVFVIYSDQSSKISGTASVTFDTFVGGTFVERDTVVVNLTPNTINANTITSINCTGAQSMNARILSVNATGAIFTY